jgi:hypothetical protein
VEKLKIKLGIERKLKRQRRERKTEEGSVRQSKTE